MLRRPISVTMSAHRARREMAQAEVKKRSKAKEIASQAQLGKELKKGAMGWKFPWSKEVREFKRPNFSLTLYKDGSRLYLFKKGGYVIVTPEGAGIIKTDPQLVRRYLKGEKLPFAEGGNATINTIKAEDSTLVAKEHHSGVSAVAQMEHMRQIRKELEAGKSIHNAPKYYGVAEIAPETKIIASRSGRGVVGVSVMSFAEGRKLSRIVEDLRAKGDSKSMRKLNKVMNDYKGFVKTLQSRKVPLTDLHEGNVLTRYDEKRKRYTFTILDQ